MVEDRGRWSGCGQTMPLAKPVDVPSKSTFRTIWFDSAVGGLLQCNLTCCESRKEHQQHRALERVELGNAWRANKLWTHFLLVSQKFSLTHSLFAH